VVVLRPQDRDKVGKGKQKKRRTPVSHASPGNAAPEIPLHLSLRAQQHGSVEGGRRVSRVALSASFFFLLKNLNQKIIARDKSG
jgi:hypothetical protein